MISVQRFIFPGIVAGCLFVVFATSLIASPNVALASSSTPVAAAMVDAATATPFLAQEDATSATMTPAMAAGDVQKPTEFKPVAPTATATQEITPPPAPTIAPTLPPPEPTAAPANNPEPASAQLAAAAPQVASSNSCTINASYPSSVQQWCGLIQTYAAKNAVDANLLAAVILQESGGDAQAYSSNGAVGLMQVMPRDGLAANFMCARGPCFASRPSSSELFDPEFNIAYGSRMLSALIKKYGDTREALRFYGPSNMEYRYADIVLGIMQRYQ